MAKCRRHGERSSHQGGGWNATRRPSFARVGERVLALRVGPVVRTALQEKLPKMGRADQVRRRLCGSVPGSGRRRAVSAGSGRAAGSLGLQVAPEKTAVLLF